MNIFEYVLNDIYPILLQSARDYIKVSDRMLTVKRHYDLKYTKMFKDPANIPDEINAKGMFVKPDHLMMSTFNLRWVDQNDLSHRAVGPAEVTMVQVQRWHREGVLHRTGRPAVTAALIKFKWLQHNAFYRACGPFEVNIHDFTANFTDGTFSHMDCKNITFEFSKMSGVKITQREIESFIKTHPEFEIDWASDDSFFPNPIDEFVFLSDIRQAK
jgi:hypothetical protein